MTNEKKKPVQKRKPLEKPAKQLYAEKLIDKLETELTKLGFDVEKGGWDSPSRSLQTLKQSLFADYRKEQVARTQARILHKMMTSRPRPPSSNIGIMFWLAKNHNEEGTYLAEVESFDNNPSEFISNIARDYRRKVQEQRLDERS